MASMNYQQRLKKEICNLWRIYEILERDSVRPLAKLDNKINQMDIECNNFKDSVAGIYKSMDNILDIILNKMSILLGIGYKPRKYANGIDGIIYTIYKTHMIDIPTTDNNFSDEKDDISDYSENDAEYDDEINKSSFNSKFYFLLGEYIGKMSKIRKLLNMSLNTDNTILLGRLRTMAIINEGLDEIEEELLERIK